jgi:hypothetical protein
MTTTEQESTLSGGSAKKPTTLKIELGVLRTSAPVSLSRWTSKSILNLRIYTNPLHPVINEDDKADEDNEYEYDEPTETVESRNRKRISGEIFERFKKTSIVRYIEAWKGLYKINREYISRALCSTPEFEKTITGMFGAFNSKVFRKSGDEWQVIDFEKLYPQVKRLPQEGIERIRSVFRQNKKKSTT